MKPGPGMSRNNPLRRSMARVEFFACMEAIESMLGQGFSRQLIYERLREDGRVSMAYVTFVKLIAKAANDELSTVSLRPEAKPTPLPAPKTAVFRPSQPNIIKVRSDELQDPRTVDPKTVF